MPPEPTMSMQLKFEVERSTPTNSPAGDAGIWCELRSISLSKAVLMNSVRWRLDRWQIRYDNAPTPGGMTSTGQVLQSGIGIRKTLEAVKDVFQQSRHAGIACGIKNTGIAMGFQTLESEDCDRISERILIHQGWTEMGQGVYTMAVQFLRGHGSLPRLSKSGSIPGK